MEARSQEVRLNHRATLRQAPLDRLGTGRAGRAVESRRQEKSLNTEDTEGAAKGPATEGHRETSEVRGLGFGTWVMRKSLRTDWFVKQSREAETALVVDLRSVTDLSVALLLEIATSLLRYSFRLRTSFGVTSTGTRGGAWEHGREGGADTVTRDFTDHR